MSTTSKKLDQEIIFRVSFGYMEEPDELIFTRDGKYRFVSSKKLKNDQTVYEIIYSRYHYAAKVNQKYHKQALAAKKSILEKEGEKDWPTGDLDARVAGRQPELYQKTLWLITHENLDGWQETFSKLEFELTLCIMGYMSSCNMMFSDDHVWEVREHENEAKEELRKMKMLIADAYSGEVSAEEFEQIFNQERKQIMLVALPQKGRDMTMYIDTAGYVRRIECQGEQTKLAEKIAQKLEKDKKFERHAEYFDKADGDEIVNVFFHYAYALDIGEVYRQNRDLAYKIYQYLAERWDEKDAFYNLGLFHAEGYGSLKKDVKTAIKYYETAIEKGDRHYAACNLGNIYATGDGVPKDEEKAMKYYWLAYANNDAYATASLAKIFEEGKAVERDRLKAWRFYKTAKDEAGKHWEEYSAEFREELEKDIARLEKKLK